MEGSCEREVIFNLELKEGDVLSQTFTNSDISIGLVYEHTSVEPVGVHKLDNRATVLVFPEDIDVKRIYTTL